MLVQMILYCLDFQDSSPYVFFRSFKNDHNKKLDRTMEQRVEISD